MPVQHSFIHSPGGHGALTDGLRVMDAARDGDTASVCSDHSGSVQAPRGAIGGPRAPQQISQLYSPTLTRNMPHDPYQAAFKVNIHPTTHYHKLSGRVRPGRAMAAERFIHRDAGCVWRKRVKEPPSLPMFVQVASNEISGPGEICMNTSCE